MAAVLAMNGDDLVAFVLQYEESCGASSNTVSSSKSYPYPERLFGSVQAVSEEGELKRVYKRLAIKLHPDKNAHADASKAFQVLQTCFEATLEVVSSGRSAAGPGAGQAQSPQQPQPQPQPQQQQQHSRTQHHHGGGKPHAQQHSAQPQPTVDAAAFFKAQKEAQRKQYYEQYQQQQHAANSAFFEQQRAKHFASQQQQQHAGTSPDDDDWESWTESKDKAKGTTNKARTTAGPPPPPDVDVDAAAAEAAAASAAEAFFTPPNASNTKKAADAQPKRAAQGEADADGFVYYWDEAAQQYYYFDEESQQSFYYDDPDGPAQKKLRKRQKAAKKAAAAASQSPYSPSSPLPAIDPEVSEEEEAAARVRKLERRLRKRRDALAEAAREERRAAKAAANGGGGGDSAEGFWTDSDDEKLRKGAKKGKKLSDVLAMDLSVSEEEDDGEGGVRKKRRKKPNMDPEVAALVDELEAAEHALASIRYAKKEAERAAQQRAAERERAKLQKSAQSLASLFAKFGIDADEEDLGLAGPRRAPAAGSAKAKRAKECPSETTGAFDSGTTRPAKAAFSPTDGSAPHAAHYPTTPTAHYDPHAAGNSAQPPSLDAGQKPSVKLTPAQALAEKRRLAALAKAATDGAAAAKPTGPVKLQVTCPHCHVYATTMSFAEAARAIACPQCKQYFVPQQQLAAALNAAGSKAASKGATIIRGGGAADRCKCGKTRKGACFLCGE